MRIVRMGLGAAAALALAVSLAGCNLTSPTRGSGPVATLSAAPVPEGEEALESFYTQSLEWSSCGGSFLCSWLTVPLDYDDPEGGTVELAVLRAPATSSSERRGSLIVNPGGPGGSGVQYAAAADAIVTQPMRRAYDVVGFDPRGVGSSSPIDCVSDRELDAFLGTDPTPDDRGEEVRFAAESRAFATSCGDNAGPLLAHVSTIDVARDLDILRSALGDETLTYLGKSYGTLIGSTYADLFPTRVGRMVLDGVVPPDLTSTEINLGQAQGFERATEAWAAYCVDQGDCPLGSSVPEVMSGIRDFLAGVDASPLARTGDPQVKQLTEGWAAIGIAYAMYSRGSWGVLIEAMTAALDGDGAPLMALANDYADRRSDGSYAGNIMEVIYAVNCIDQPNSDNPADYEAAAQRAAEVAPTWGPYLMWSSLPCGFWPVPAAGTPHPVSAQGSPPILVIGTTRDPATPFEWSERLNDQLADSALISYDGDGHTAYTRSNSCVDNAVDAYYLDGTVPTDGLQC